MGTDASDRPLAQGEIAQVGIVVRDAARTASRYSEIFGIGPWSFFDFTPSEVVLHGERLGEVDSCVRAALADLGGVQVELLQPLWGPGTHREFLDTHGEGAHHVSFGIVKEHDAIVERLRERGVGIEMQGLLEGAFTFTYLDTTQTLGAIFELVRGSEEDLADLDGWGESAPSSAGVVDVRKRPIVQVGIVVDDAEAAARSYWELLGIGPWTFIDFEPPHVSGGVLHGVPMRDVDVRVRAALAECGRVQLELLQPREGPGTHMEFLKARGPGIHHVSFGAVGDHDAVVAAFAREGIGVEMSGVLGGAATFTYLASQDDLGLIFELVKLHPGAETTLLPYGRHPAG